MEDDCRLRHVLIECLSIARAGLDEREPRLVDQVRDVLASALAEIIQHDDRVPQHQAPLCQMRADKPGPARNQEAAHCVGEVIVLRLRAKGRRRKHPSTGE